MSGRAGKSGRTRHADAGRSAGVGHASRPASSEACVWLAFLLRRHRFVGVRAVRVLRALVPLSPGVM